MKVDRFYASTKTCSCCGYRNDKVILGVNEWDFPACGAHHVRDVNAAVNIKEEGLRILAEYFRSWLEKDAAARERAQKRSDGRRKQKAA